MCFKETLEYDKHFKGSELTQLQKKVNHVCSVFWTVYICL